MERAEAALCWIVSILTARNIPFVVSGGLAVRIHGGTRPLYDIDLDIPEARFEEISAEIRPYISRHWGRFIDNLFDVQLASLDYHGQPIDLTGGESVRLFDTSANKWRSLPTDFAAVEVISLYGLDLPVQRRELLIEYKEWLGREEDLQDIRELRTLVRKL